MILIGGQSPDMAALTQGLGERSVEREVLRILSASEETYRYDSQEQLQFELNLRREIVKAATALSHSGMDFETFRESRCNEAFWKRGSDGGFALKDGVKASDAIMDIFRNGSKYGTECATAMMIVYHKALLEVFGAEAFDKMFPNLYLMNWHRISSELREVGIPRREKDYLPGDRRYFSNPDVNPETPEWQGENVIDMGNGYYYGHGAGVGKAEFFIRALNGNRKKDADQEAFLMDNAGRPSFRRLYTLYQRQGGAA